jgi:hypothetical protein
MRIRLPQGLCAELRKKHNVLNQTERVLLMSFDTDYMKTQVTLRREDNCLLHFYAATSLAPVTGNTTDQKACRRGQRHCERPSAAEGSHTAPPRVC